MLVGAGVAAGVIGGVLVYRSSLAEVSVGLNGPSLVAAGRF
jgi:hypothetical protein